MDWSKSRLSQLFSGLIIADGSAGLSLSINSLESVSGVRCLDMKPILRVRSRHSADLQMPHVHAHLYMWQMYRSVSCGLYLQDGTWFVMQVAVDRLTEFGAPQSITLSEL